MNSILRLFHKRNILVLKSFLILFVFYFLATNLYSQDTNANDWPMFRHDSQRSGATTLILPDQLNLKWTRQLAALETAWPDDTRIQFDKNYHPIVIGKTIFLTSSKNDCLYAIASDTGEILWKFFADAPIRFAPAGTKDKLFFVSDDSYLYCLQIKTGKLLWKYRGAPNDSKIFVNGRLASPWPARGAPAIDGNQVYFSAGIWPFMGVFIYAINTETGKPIWINSGSGSIYMTQGHDSQAFAGPAPQGYITATKDVVLIPNGRSLPAGYNSKTGDLLYYQLPLKAAGYFVPASDNFFFFSNTAFRLNDGKAAGNLPTPSIITSDNLYTGSLQSFDLKNTLAQEPKKPEDKSPPILPLTQLWKETLKVDIQFFAGNRLYASSGSTIFAYDLPEYNKEIKAPKLAWQLEVKGIIAELIAADNKIIGVTNEGSLFCLSNLKDVTTTPPILKETAQPLDESSITSEDSILRTTNIRDGYAIVLGVGTGMLAEQLVRKTNLNVFVIEPDAALVNKFRKKWDEYQIYGTRLAIHQGNPFEFLFPPYMANLVVSENIDFNKEKVSNVVAKIFHTLRPYGGTACLKIPPQLRDKWTMSIYENKLRMAANRNKNDWALLVREGQLIGAGDWSHQYGDAANSLISNDSLVKMPLGLLWFGGPSNKNVLPRHGHGPNPQVAGGRVVTEGPSNLQAYDAYTGRMFWELEIIDLGKAYDNSDHQPGANSIGSNYVTLADYIYVVFRGTCLKLEAETGALTDTFVLPPLEGKTEPAKWGFIATSGDYLIATAEPIDANAKEIPGKMTWNGTTSKAIIVLNRHTGKLVWKKEAVHGFRHNAIAIGNEMVYCIDLVPPEIKLILSPNGTDSQGKIFAFDLKTGGTIWSTETGVFGTWLSYSAEHDILLQAGRPSRDMLNDEPKNRMSAFQGKDGRLLWDKPLSFSGPCLLNDKDILTQNAGFNLFDGTPKYKKDPITNDSTLWTLARNYGCTTAVGSKNLLTFRSAAAAYFDLTNNSGTGNFGGFRPSCTSNLIIAEGLLNIPDYTRPCTCSYQVQSSLALINQPNVETWTFTSTKWNKKPIQSLGVNLGAPGDHLSETGTLWVEFPVTGGPSQEIPIKTTPDNISWFRQHSSLIQDNELAFVGASGAKGIQSLTIPTGNIANVETYYTVRLIFCELDEIKPNERIMDISIQGKLQIEALDIIKETKETRKVLVKELKSVKAGAELLIELNSNAKATKKETLLCGIEISVEK